MEQSGITVYGADWCGDCRRAKKFMDDKGVAYNWVNIENDPSAIELVLKLNGGKRVIPTIVFEDGSVLVEPTNSELAGKLGVGK
ncbi:MAG: NrdH-redoxin [Chloroflexota bacterium]|nr:NrdH-redoxin [Chloroflexota bacterium]MDE2941860.1 NrdH-redoxin [Chloroflexota bacterium]MDE3268332.1 NrdH-redoxin [Chloroflexota bacterium]